MNLLQNGYADLPRKFSAEISIGSFLPIGRVALDLGYGSQSSFTTLFTRVMGMPPARFLRKMTDKAD